MKLERKVAIVTGAASGIGAAIALRFAREGAKVALFDKASCAATIANMPHGARFEEYNCDLTDIQQAKHAVNQAGRDFSRIDILVNAAGLFRGVPIAEVDTESWNFQIDILLKAPFFLIQSVLPYMQAVGGGKIVNISSICSAYGLPGTVVYSAAKGGVTAMTRALMCELAPQNININTIAPGNIATPLNAHLREMNGYVTKWTELTPSGVPFPDPDVIAGTAVFLASDDASNVHGQELLVDGGVSAGLSAGAISLENAK